MASTTSMVLLPGWRITIRLMARCPPFMRVQPGYALVVLHAVNHHAQVFQTHGRAVAVGYHRRPVLPWRS